MEVTNPGLVNVADEAEGNPDPNSGTATAAPRQTGSLVPAADQAQEPPPGAGAESVSFPTPTENEADAEVVSGLPLVEPEPEAVEVEVDEQQVGQGGMQPVDPANLAMGYKFVPPAEHVVTGPATTFQTNQTSQDLVTVTVTSVLDADTAGLPTPETTRYRLLTAPPSLTSYPVSLLGRQIVFTDLSANPGAARTITGYSGDFVVVNREDTDPGNGSVATLSEPLPGDTFQVSTQRLGAEEVSTTAAAAVDVFILPEPPQFSPSPAQALLGGGTSEISTGPQPAPPAPSSGTPAPPSRTVEVADQSSVVGLPVNVFV